MFHTFVKRSVFSRSSFSRYASTESYDIKNQTSPRICMIGAPVKNNFLLHYFRKDTNTFKLKGSGKGTVSKYIKQENNVDIYSTGDMLRAHANDGTELGNKVRDIMVKGGLFQTERSFNV